MRPTRNPFRTRFGGAHIAIVAMCALAMLFLPAAAQDDINEVGVIIDYGDERTTWVWIPFDEPEPPLIDLLNETDLEMVTVGFGGLGEAVCQIDDTGCPATDCRQSMCQSSSTTPFWRMMKLVDGEWSMTGSGVSGTTVVDGEIYAISWSSEDPDLPVVTIDELAENAGADIGVLPPEPAIHTDGEADDEASPAAWAPAAGALVLVLVVAGFLVFRARSRRGADR